MVTNLNELTALIASDLSKSTSTRQTLGGGGTAFGWGAELPATLASYVTTATSEGLAVPVTLVTESGTPVAVVTPGNDKPKSTQIQPTTLNLSKFAGYAQIQLEQQLNAAGLYPAVVSVLSAGALRAFEAAAMAVLDSQSGAVGTGADWLTAIYAGQGAILANGGRPSVLVLSAADYGAVMAEITTGPGFALDPSSPTGVLAGSTIHFSSGLSSGKGFVVDSSAVLCVQHVASPILSIDSSGINNTTRVIADLVAGTIVTNPDLVAELSVTGP